MESEEEIGSEAVEGGQERQTFANYELLEEIGRGGMGIVYKARDISLNRLVALKMLNPARLVSQESLRRFQLEAAAIAKLDYPNILPAYEFGRKGGQCFFSMRLIEGGNLAERIAAGEFVFSSDASGRALQERIASLVGEIAGAVQYAHEHGIIHRDLKPSNILIDADGRPYVADFGLAKLAEHDEDLTRTQAAMGTPSYIAPEQAAGGAQKLTASADIYGIGLILYELLTGHRAFEGENAFEVLRRIREDEPLRPRVVNPVVDRDLELICLKCLEKDPRARFASAGALAEELSRWRRRMPIASRPATALEKLAKWYRREPLVAGLVTVASLAIAGGLAASLWQGSRAREAARRAEETNTKFELQIAGDMLSSDQGGAGVAYLADVLKRDPMNTVAAERLVSALSERGFCIPALTLAHRDVVRAAHFSPNGLLVATAAGNAACIWNARTGGLVAGPMTNSGMVHELEFTPDSTRLATATEGGVRLWNATNGAPVGRLDCQADIRTVHFSPDGRLLLASGSNSNAWLFDVASGHLEWPSLNTAYVWRSAFSPGGELAALACDDGKVLLWDCRAGRVHQEFNQGAAAYACDFSPSGTELMSAGENGELWVWNVSTGLPMLPPIACGGPLLHALFSPDGTHIAGGAGNANASIWDAKTGRKATGPLKHWRGVCCVAFARDGRLLLTSSFDKTARVWDVQSGLPVCEPLQCLDEVRQAEFSPDGTLILTRSLTTNAQVWSLRIRSSEGASFALHARVVNLRLSPDGRRALAIGADHCALVWDLAANDPSIRVLRGPSMFNVAAFSVAADRVVTGGLEGKLCVWNAANGALLDQCQAHGDVINAIRFSRDGRRLLTTSNDRTAKIWEFPSLREVATFQHSDASRSGGFGPVRDGDLSPDGRYAATVTWDNAAWIWDITNQRLVHGPLRHAYTLQNIRFSTDSRRMTTLSMDRMPQIWDVRTGAPIGQPGPPQAGASDESQSRVIATTHDHFAYVRDCATGNLLLEPIRHEADVDCVCLSDDGSIALSASADGMVLARTVPHIALPVPAWLPAFAEGIAGHRVGQSGAAELGSCGISGLPSGTAPRGGAEAAWLSWSHSLVTGRANTGSNGLQSCWPATATP